MCSWLLNVSALGTLCKSQQGLSYLLFTQESILNHQLGGTHPNYSLKGIITWHSNLWLEAVCISLSLFLNADEKKIKC